MLSTLAKIGEHLLEGKGVWARLTTEPKYDSNKRNWVCPILFDCVNKEIRILKDEMELFKPDESIIKFKYLSPSLWGPRGKKCSLTVAPKNFEMLEETIFGKGSDGAGSMTRSIDDFPEFSSRPIYKVLQEIHSTLNEHTNRLDLSEIKKGIGFGSEDEIVLFYSVVKSELLNNSAPIKMTDTDGFDDFIVHRFGTNQNGEPGLDYMSGEPVNEVVQASFSGRYNIHKIFQTTSVNYATNFKSFKRNFQGDADVFAAMDKASQYVLDNYQTRIAGITHIVVPHFLNKDLELFRLNEMKLYLNKSNDLLFGYESLDADIEQSLPEFGLFWINYIGFESDGKSFKIMSHIKDVNSVYLAQLTENFIKTGLAFQDYIGGKYPFNLRSVSNIIPVRDSGKSKINPALTLFKDILEQRPIQSEVIFKHFIELMLCHWYERYAAFKNIRKIDSIDFAIKDAVYKYSALIYTLKQLKLIDMEKQMTDANDVQTSTSDFQKRVQTFFERMNYSEEEKALFYLGRVLSAVAYAQYKKGHESKPVLNKVNYNGMDAESILRLSLDLREKTRQYTIHDKTEWNFSEFTDKFNEKAWTLSKEQGVFYLMAGYSFGLTKSDNNH